MRIHAIGFSAVVLLVCACLSAQNNTANSAVPKLVRFSGKVSDASGKPLNGVVGLTFSLYKDEQGSAPLWLETQNVQLDNSGHYTVFLGASKPDGLPLELFASGEARWLGVQPQGQPEQPRVLLLAVPYALKAADAETVGGLPPSAFAMATPLSGSSGAAVTNSAAAPRAGPAFSGTGTTNYIPLWLSSTKLGSSKLFQSTAGNVGIGTTTPAATFDVNGAVNAATGYNLGGSAFAYGSYASQNAFVGFAGNATMTGRQNTATGYEALYSNTTGTSNTAVGMTALSSNTTGYNNTAVGELSLLSNTSGVQNTALGLFAGKSNSTGIWNTFLGYNADSSKGNLAYATAIGAESVVSESNALVLGGTGPAAVRVGIGTATPSAQLDVVGSLKLEGSGNGITFPDGSTQTTAAATGMTTLTSVFQNYTSSTNLRCPSGYIVAVASCNAAGGYFVGSIFVQGGTVVLNDQSSPLPPGASSWAHYLTPSASAATGVHCNLGGAVSSQAQLRCAHQ